MFIMYSFQGILKKYSLRQPGTVQTVLKYSDKYQVKHIIKFGDYNVGRERQLLTLPNYMQFLLDLEPEKSSSNQLTLAQ